MKKIEGGKISPTHPSIHLPTHQIKLFWSFKKVGYYRVKWKCQNTFLDQLPIMDPFGICVRSSHRGMKQSGSLLDMRRISLWGI